MTHPTLAIAPETELFAATYLHAVRVGDRRAAVDAALDMHDSGVPAEQVITGLLAPAQAEVGRGWEEGRWGVALEHRATSIAESALSALMRAAEDEPTTPPQGACGRAAVVCAEGEWHSLPARMMADVLRLRGVEVAFVGPSMPAAELDAFLGPAPPPAVAVSCSLSASLPGAWRAVTVLRRLGLVVVAGGRGFGAHGRWARTLGADSWAPSFTLGADLVLRAQEEPPRPARTSPVPDGRADEVRQLDLFGDGVVERCLTEAIAAWPTMMSRDAAVLATRNDLRTVLRTVAAAVLVDDAGLVEDFVAWFERVLRARDLPLGMVSSSFDLLLHWIPKALPGARAMAESGLAACSQAPLPRG